MEYADLIAVVEMLQEIHALPGNAVMSIGARMSVKKIQVESFLEYSKVCGTLEGGNG